VAADPAVATQIPATFLIGPVADARDRSVELIARPIPGTAMPAWVRPGVTAHLDVVMDGRPEEELAIPVAATIRDGLQVIYFRRDREHPDQVVRVEADLGARDGRWVVVQSGLKEGDQVVLGGIYPLKLSQQTGGAQAGHFEADGTFHIGTH
jgi:multidrug efflux pump subunit AcrA (membrane-fusion protein)